MIEISKDSDVTPKSTLVASTLFFRHISTKKLRVHNF